MMGGCRLSNCRTLRENDSKKMIVFPKTKILQRVFSRSDFFTLNRHVYPWSNTDRKLTRAVEWRNSEPFGLFKVRTLRDGRKNRFTQFREYQYS